MDNVQIFVFVFIFLELGNRDSDENLKCSPLKLSFFLISFFKTYNWKVEKKRIRASNW